MGRFMKYATTGQDEVVVPGEAIEPTLLSKLDFESSAPTSPFAKSRCCSRRQQLYKIFAKRTTFRDPINAIFVTTLM